MGRMTHPPDSWGLQEERPRSAGWPSPAQSSWEDSGTETDRLDSSRSVQGTGPCAKSLLTGELRQTGARPGLGTTGGNSVPPTTYHKPSGKPVHPISLKRHFPHCLFI